MNQEFPQTSGSEMMPPWRIDAADPSDRPLLVRMSQHASVIEDRPLPHPQSEDVQDQLPTQSDIALVAKDMNGEGIGAAWLYVADLPLLTSDDGAAVPEMVIAIDQNTRGRGLGGELIDRVAVLAESQFDAICLNVHVRNPAKRLYETKGFVEMGKGRGELGLLMRLDLTRRPSSNS